MAPRKPIDQSDHDLLIEIRTMQAEIAKDVADLNTAMYGADKKNGLIGWVQGLNTKVKLMFSALMGVISVLGWLVALHVHV
jgi:hypothetical protein